MEPSHFTNEITQKRHQLKIKHPIKRNLVIQIRLQKQKKQHLLPCFQMKIVTLRQIDTRQDWNLTGGNIRMGTNYLQTEISLLVKRL